ncbi:MAG: hypothetical protein JSR21_12330 [Proteobacteria bacterium]|nr:hypothetical protein [Pseudomonadota bacterium]
MIRRSIRNAAIRASAPLLLLAACAEAPQTPQQRASQELLNACRQRADQIFMSQNRGAQYETSNSLTPYSAGPSTGLPTQGLSVRYARDQMVDDCVRNLGTQTQRSSSGSVGPLPPSGAVAAPPAAAASPASPPPASLSLPPASATPAQLAVPPGLNARPAP